MKLAALKVGDVLYPDGGFECMELNVPIVVMADDGGAYVTCGCGHHYLDGQLDWDDGETLVGLTDEPWRQ